MLEKIIIICPIHGNFTQNPNDHLNKCGCRKCAGEYMSQFNINNSLNWSYTNWEKSAKISKEFESFKVYIIECWNEKEKFYKIGKTFKNIKRRFKNKSELPYDYKVIKIIIGSSREMSELEQELKNINKESRYIPNLTFGGQYECFSKITLDEYTI